MIFFFLFYNIEPPKENGGAEVTKYVVELSEGLSGKLQVVKKKMFENYSNEMETDVLDSDPQSFKYFFLSVIRCVMGAGVFRASCGARV